MKTQSVVAFLAVAATLPAAGRQPGEPGVLTVRVVNEAGIDSRPLNQAKGMLTRIFNSSGIDLVWMVCETGRAVWGGKDPCHKQRGPAEFWMYITATKQAHTSGEMLGFTVLDETVNGGSSGVYLPAAELLVSPAGARLGDILGAAMAHELGHLLLGAGAHTRTGVMCASWGRAELERLAIGELLFEGGQARLLRERIRGPESDGVSPVPGVRRLTSSGAKSSSPPR